MKHIKKKILYVITKSNFGGAQRYVFELATELPPTEYEVTVACGGDGPLKEKLEGAGITVHTIKNFERDINLRKELGALKELWHLIRAEKPDIVHLNSSKAGGSGSLIARLLGVKTIVFTAHGWPFNEPRGFFWQSIVWCLSYLTALLAHRVIVVSECDRAHHRMPFVAHKITLIRTALPDVLLQDRVTARAHFERILTTPPPQQALWIGTIGEYTRNKNLLLGIQAVEKIHKDFGLSMLYLLIGVDGEERPRLEAYIDEHNLKDFIHLVGFVDNAREYLRAFDIFLMPSLKEGMPYALLEAGRAGLACVASAVGGIPEVITHQKNGLLIDPNNVTALTNALRTLAGSEALRDQYGHALQNKIEREFGFVQMLEKTEAVYQNVGRQQS